MLCIQEPFEGLALESAKLKLKWPRRLVHFTLGFGFCLTWLLWKVRLTRSLRTFHCYVCLFRIRHSSALQLQSLRQNVVSNSKAQHKSRYQKDTHNIWKLNLTLFYKWTATNQSFNYGQYMYITRDWCTHSKPCKQQLTNRVIWQAVNLDLKDNFIIFSIFLGNYVYFSFLPSSCNAD